MYLWLSNINGLKTIIAGILLFCTTPCFEALTATKALSYMYYVKAMGLQSLTLHCHARFNLYELYRNFSKLSFAVSGT